MKEKGKFCKKLRATSKLGAVGESKDKITSKWFIVIVKVYIAHLTNKSKETNCKSSLRLCYSHFSTVEFYGVQIREFECTQF